MAIFIICFTMVKLYPPQIFGEKLIVIFIFSTINNHKKCSTQECVEKRYDSYHKIMGHATQVEKVPSAWLWLAPSTLESQ